VKLLISLLVTLFVTEQASSPQQIADELLAADRAFSAASSKTDLITGLSAMFADDVTMPVPGLHAYGTEEAIDALRANPANTGAKAVWTPARVAISRDGFHGFTAGFMTITRADGSVNPAKYLAYWVKQKNGWRVAVYKRTQGKAVVDMTTTYLLPPSIMVSMMQPERIENDRESLMNAEKSFAAEAQQIGLGPAFRKYGSPDAINLGGPNTPGFTRGNDEIATFVGQNEPSSGSSVNWAPQKAIVAVSGDFGVTIGYITWNSLGPDGKKTPPSPFFTIWKKDASGAWKYIAE